MAESVTGRKNCSAESFIACYQKSNSLEEAATKLGLKPDTVKQRAYSFKKLGVVLKKFSTTRVKLSNDADRLANLIKLANESLEAEKAV